MTDHFEAKKHAYRQTQDGIVVSFVVHPNDVSAMLATAPLGTRYMVAFAEIGEDGKPANATVAQSVRVPPNVGGDAGSTPAGPLQKERRPFDTLPLSQQAAIRCTDKQFQRFLNTDEDGAAHYVREYCSVSSRANIKEGQNSGKDWLLLESGFQQWLTDRQYASIAR